MRARNGGFGLWLAGNPASGIAARQSLRHCTDPPRPDPMSVDADTVRRVAHLARIAVADDEVANLQGELNAILAFVEQLTAVDVKGVEPMTSVTPMAMKMREDVVTDGDIADEIVQNAPEREDHFFVVPKVVE